MRVTLLNPKTGKNIKVTKFVLKYPETILPPTVIESKTASVAVDDNDNIVEEESTEIVEQPKSEVDEIEELFN